MISNLVVFALGAFVIFSLVRRIIEAIQSRRFRARHGCKPAHDIARYRGLFGIDTYLILKRNAQDRISLQEMTRRASELGRTTSVVVLGTNFISTCEPENIKTVLATKFDDFSIGLRIGPLGPLLGKGIFTLDDKPWQHSRALIRPGFTRAQVADLTSIEQHVQQLIRRIPSDGATIDLQPLFVNFTLDSATEFLFGQSVNCQGSSEDSKSRRFSEAFDYAEAILQRRSAMGRMSFLLRDKKFDEACATVHRFTDNYISSALQGHAKPGRYNLLAELAQACQDPLQLRNELLNILLAARDTTASLLSSVFYLLARHPAAWKRLNAEVNRLEGQIPDYAALKEMNYLRSVLQETLRLLPPVPTNMRVARRNTTLPRGGGPDGTAPVFVAKGSIVYYIPWVMHRLPEIYGTDADAFRPERWLDDENPQPLRPGWGYLPFNGGPRICLGQQSALTEASCTVVRLVQTFDKIEVRDPLPWQEHAALTLSNLHGTKVALWRRI